MKITKQRLKEMIKEEIDKLMEVDPAEKAMQMGSSISMLMKDPKVDKLSSQVADSVSKLSSTQKAVVASAMLGKMGFGPDDVESIKSMISKMMAPTEEPGGEPPVEGPPEEL